jgi:hypothetical protein
MGGTQFVSAEMVPAGEPRNVGLHPNGCAANTAMQQNKSDYQNQYNHEPERQGQQRDKNLLRLILPQDHGHRCQAQQSKKNPLPSPTHHFAYAVSVASMPHGVPQGGFLLRSARAWTARTSMLE